MEMVKFLSKSVCSFFSSLECVGGETKQRKLVLSPGRHPEDAEHCSPITAAAHCG